VIKEEGATFALGCILQLSNGRKAKQCVTEVATINNMFLKQAASVITPSHEVSVPCKMGVLAYLSSSVVAGQCGVSTQA
jgi:hypothetical protein